MRLRLLNLITLLLWPGLVWAAPDTTLSVSPSASAGTVITAADENSRNSTISTAYNAHSHTDITQVGTPLNVGAASGTTQLSAASLVLEGATADAFETTITVTDPTADRTITLPNSTGNVVVFETMFTPDQQLFFEGSTSDAFETTLAVTNPTADRTITLTDASGTIVLTNSAPTLAGVTVDTLTTSTVGPGTPAANTLYTDNIIKGWIKFADGGTAAITDDFNVTSIADNGTGDYTITWDRDFANDSYAAVGTSLDATSPDHFIVVVAQAAGTLQVNNANSGGTLAYAATAYVIAVGD